MNFPKIATTTEFEALRTFLAAAGYTQSQICESLGLGSVDKLDLVTLSGDLSKNMRTPGALRTLIRLFLLGESVPLTEIKAHIPNTAWEAIKGLDLIEEYPGDGDRCFCSVALYPVENLYIASDRWSEPDHKPKQSFPDVVYPALTKSTQEFLRFLPATPCGEFLELCGGTGIAAVMASRYSVCATSSDITERSTRFAEFNTLLNGASNVSAVQGDLYAAVEGHSFDRIVAHPPYMPVLRPAEIYYDGGEDGEQLTRRILEDLPQYLNRGGRLYCRTLGSDRKTAPFEERLRSWLGKYQNEFDIALFISKNLDPERFAMDAAIRKEAGQTEVAQWRMLFERLGVRELLTGMIVVQRHVNERPAFTIRRSLSPAADCAATEKVLEWETELAEETCAEKILASAPLASPRTELLIRHRCEAGEFLAKEFTLSCRDPFLMDCQIQPWMGGLVSRCDGLRTVKQLYSDCLQAGWIRQGTPLGEFVHLVGVLVSGGFLLVEPIKPLQAEG